MTYPKAEFSIHPAPHIGFVSLTVANLENQLLFHQHYFTVDIPDQATYDQVVARVGAASVSSNQTEVGLLLHDPSQNDVVLRVDK